jgi:hypothetical protein
MKSAHPRARPARQGVEELRHSDAHFVMFRADMLSDAPGE